MATVIQKTASQPLGTDGLNVLRSAVAEYDREQLLWSSGYLAGMAAVGVVEHLPLATQAREATKRSTWSIFYATETGNSRRIAESLAEQSRAAGLGVELHDLRDYRPKSLTRVENALFVIATHGLGDAPDGSEMFFEYWLSDKAPRLERLNYSVLALGDSSYVDYCEVGRILDQRLKQLGATSVVGRVDCDLDYEIQAAQWTGTVVERATEISDAVAIPRTSHLKSVSTAPVVSRTHPFAADLLVNQKITGNRSSKDVRHIELSLEGSDLAYLPGDSLGVMPQNPPELVERLLEIVKLDGREEVNGFGKPLALVEALTRHKEITVLNRPFLDAVAVEHKNLQAIVADRNNLAGFFKTRQVIDVVADYPKTWQAQEFVDALRKLSPRLYSIASDPDTNPGEAHLTVAAVRYTLFGRPHWGAASNYLSGGADQVPVYVETNDHFRLPPAGDLPIIMIGAGTGIAPYRAFVEHRREHGHRGENWLVFGDRNLATDFLYQIEWLRYRKDGTLNRLDLAFSRDQKKKVYVQHRILEQAKLIYSWLERGAHIYVCGDADQMAKDVNEALLAVLRNEGGLSEERAAEYLGRLKSERRYQRDVY